MAKPDTGRAPSILWANYFEFFSSVLQAWPVIASPGLRQDQALVWVQNAVFEPAVLGDAFSADDRRLLCELVGRFSRESRQKLKLLMDDVSKIANSEAESNVLQSFQVS